MRIAQAFLSRTAALALLLVIPSCSDETTPPSGPANPEPVTSGHLELTIEASGARPDADGFEISLKLSAGEVLTRSIEPTGGTVTFPDLALGVYLVRVQGLDAHCSVSGSNPRGVTIKAGETTNLVVGIFCPGHGAVLVRTVSRGLDIDPVGYTVHFEPWLSDAPPTVVHVGTGDSLLIPEGDLPVAARWTVRLHGIRENCFVASGDTRTLRPLRQATVTIAYEVTCISRSSLIVFDSGGEIYLTGGSSAVNLSNHPAIDTGPSLSPDRSRIVFASDRDDPGLAGHDLYVVNVDGTGLLRLTRGPGSFRVGPQAWSPDGSRIVAWMELGDTSDIYVVNADGSGMVRLVSDAAWDTDPAWSPDGSAIAFCSIRGQDDIHPIERVLEVYRASAADGTGIVKLALGCDPAWSPDGSRIAISTWSFSFGRVLSVIASGGSPLHELRIGAAFASQSGPANPSWSPDGKQIVFERSIGLSIVGYTGSGFGAVAPYLSGRSPSWR